MANLFGPSPTEIMAARQKELEDRQQAEYIAMLETAKTPAERTYMMAGRTLSQALSPLIGGGAGADDPMLNQARITQRILTQYGPEAINDPQALSDMARTFASFGMNNEAFQLAGRAMEIRKSEPKSYVVKTGKELLKADPNRYSGVYPSHRYKIDVKSGDAEDMTPSRMLSPLQAGEVYVYDEDVNSPTFGEPIGVRAMPGSKRDLDEKAEELSRKQKFVEASVGATNILKTIQDTRETASKYWYALGLPSRLLQAVGWTSKADRVRTNIQQIRSNLGLDQISKLKSMSPTGSTGLGQVSNIELNSLQSAIAALDQSMTEEDFLYQLDKIESSYINLVKRLGEESVRLELEQSPELFEAYKAAGLISDEKKSEGPEVIYFYPTGT